MDENISLRSSGRNDGIDALRIVSMLMVVILHVLGQGNVLGAAEPFVGPGKITGQYAIGWFFETAACCAVNCYALASGYVGVRAKYRYTNFALLWLRVAFYTVGITVLFYLFVPGAVKRPEWINAFFPVLRSQYWYFTAYAGLFLFMPVLNIALDKLEKKQILLIFLGFFVAFSILPNLFRKDAFMLVGGYCVWWLMILYLVGGVYSDLWFVSKTECDLDVFRIFCDGLGDLAPQARPYGRVFLRAF